MKEQNISNNNHKYYTSAHLKYLCRYHVIFCPKYRRKVLGNGVDIRLKEVFLDIAKDHNFDIIDMEAWK